MMGTGFPCIDADRRVCAWVEFDNDTQPLLRLHQFRAPGPAKTGVFQRHAHNGLAFYLKEGADRAMGATAASVARDALRLWRAKTPWFVAEVGLEPMVLPVMCAQYAVRPDGPFAGFEDQHSSPWRATAESATTAPLYRVPRGPDWFTRPEMADEYERLVAAAAEIPGDMWVVAEAIRKFVHDGVRRVRSAE